MCQSLTLLQSVANPIDDHHIVMAVCLGLVVCVLHCVCFGYTLQRMLSGVERHITTVLSFITLGILAFMGWCVVLKVVFAPEHLWLVIMQQYTWLARRVSVVGFEQRQPMLQLVGTCTYTVANLSHLSMGDAANVIINPAHPTNVLLGTPHPSEGDIVRLCVAAGIVVVCYVVFIIDFIVQRQTDNDDSDTDSDDSMLIASFVPQARTLHLLESSV